MDSIPTQTTVQHFFANSRNAYHRRETLPSTHLATPTSNPALVLKAIGSWGLPISSHALDRLHSSKTFLLGPRLCLIPKVAVSLEKGAMERDQTGCRIQRWDTRVYDSISRPFHLPKNTHPKRRSKGWCHDVNAIPADNGPTIILRIPGATHPPEVFIRKSSEKNMLTSYTHLELSIGSDVFSFDFAGYTNSPSNDRVYIPSQRTRTTPHLVSRFQCRKSSRKRSMRSKRSEEAKYDALPKSNYLHLSFTLARKGDFVWLFVYEKRKAVRKNGRDATPLWISLCLKPCLWRSNRREIDNGDDINLMVVTCSSRSRYSFRPRCELSPIYVE